MRNQLAISLITASLLVAPGAAFAQSTTAQGAANGARTGGAVAGPVGEIIGGTVGAAVGAAAEGPNPGITSVEGVARGGRGAACCDDRRPDRRGGAAAGCGRGPAGAGLCRLSLRGGE